MIIKLLEENWDKILQIGVEAEQRMKAYMAGNVIFEGVTLKGKNRINEHGACWKVVDTRDGKVLFEALNTGYLKWGPEPDFRIVERD
jgi:glutamate/tyrosine decarboxylase-like PLP-dependent enzyme